MTKNNIAKKDNRLSISEVKTETSKRKSQIRENNKGFFTDQFKRRTESIKAGDEFRVKDVLGDHWDELSNGLKRGIGSKIAKEVDDGNIENLKVSRRENNATYYVTTNRSDKNKSITNKKK